MRPNFLLVKVTCRFRSSLILDMEIFFLPILTPLLCNFPSINSIQLVSTQVQFYAAICACNQRPITMHYNSVSNLNFSQQVLYCTYVGFYLPAGIKSIGLFHLSLLEKKYCMFTNTKCFITYKSTQSHVECCQVAAWRGHCVTLDHNQWLADFSFYHR